MKKIFIYILVALTAAAVSCTREPSNFDKGIPSDHTSISLKPVVVSPVTKAENEPKTEAGDDTFNENTISGYYWFIYSDAAGSDMLLGGYQAGDVSKEVLLDDYFPNGGTGYVYVIANLPTKPEGTGDAEWYEYVPAVKDDPETTGVDETASAKLKHVVRSGSDENTHSYECTVASLKTIEFGKDTPVVNNAIVAGQSEFYNYTSATTGVPAPANFVMRTSEGESAGPQAFTLQQKTLVQVTAGLKRVAAKIILDLHVAQEVKQTATNPTTGLEDYKKTWIADIEHIQIYMLWGSTHGDLAGNTVSYSTENQKWFYSASPRYAMYKNPDGGNYNASANMVEGAVPSSSYQLTEYPVSSSVWDVVYQIDEAGGDNVWKWNSGVAVGDMIEDNIGNTDFGSWVKEGWKWKDGVATSAKTEENVGNISYGEWVYVLDEDNNPKPALDVNGNIQRTQHLVTENKPYYKISSLPLYSMPIEWNVNDAHAPFIKIILPWQGCIRANEGDGDITEYDMKNGQRKTTEFYYKILVPKTTTLDANGCYHIKLDLAVLGSEADDVPVELSGEYHVVDWNEPIEMGGDQSAGLYLKVAHSTYDMYGNSLTIPVSASGPIVVTAINSTTGNPTGTYPLATSNTTRSLDYSTTLSTGTYFMVKPDANARFVKVDHTILPFSTSFSSANGNAKDIAKITYTFRISLEGHSDFYKDITVTQYPSIYVARRQSAGSPFVNGTDNGAATNDQTPSYSLGSVSRNGYGDLYNTIVSISTLSGLASTYPNWVIGDPRIRLADAYNGTFQNVPSYHNDHGDGSNDTEWRRTDLGDANDYFDNYLVGDKDASNFIAPRFMLASGYGYNSSAGTGSNWKLNSERCASYQEDGFPAGRWRLPTEAELLFCATLASNGLISNPFRSNTSYWATSGRALNYSDNSSNWNFSLNNLNNARSSRCIYDVWYWGDNPVVTPGTYKVMLPE